MNRCHKPAEPQRTEAQPVGIQLRRLLFRCMAETLTALQYKVFVLSSLEGMSQRSVAQELHLAESTVSRHNNAAKQRLRQALGYEFQLEDPDFYGELASTYEDMDSEPHVVSTSVPRDWLR